MTTDSQNDAPASEGSHHSLLQHAISRAFGDSPHPELRRIDVVVDNERIVLSGTVPTFYLKQMAQETARQACPNRKVYNDLNVIRHST